MASLHFVLPKRLSDSSAFSIFWNRDSIHFFRLFCVAHRWKIFNYISTALPSLFILYRYLFAHLYLHFGSFLRSFETIYSATNTGSSSLIRKSIIHYILPYESHVIFNIEVPCLSMECFVMNSISNSESYSSSSSVFMPSSLSTRSLFFQNWKALLDSLLD